MNKYARAFGFCERTTGFSHHKKSYIVAKRLFVTCIKNCEETIAF